MNRNALFAALTFLTICSVIAVAAMDLHRPGVKLDAETLCPIGKPPSGAVVLVLDATDPWSEEQLTGLRSWIRKIADRLRTGEEFSVYELPAIAPAIPKPKFAMCSPGNGSDADALTQGAKLLRERFNARFMGPLDAYVSTLRTLHSAPTTPLLEVLSAISTQDDFRATRGRRVLYVASDMLQNYDGVSHYRRNIGSYAKFVKTEHGKDLKANLDGVEVHILYLINPRAAAYQGKRHITWYRDYVKANGGTLVSVTPL